MFDTNLTQAVENFAAVMLPLSEKDLEREWIWKDHDEEGIRFACFVTLQELRHLAVELSALRTRPTAAQHILSQYHAAYMDLQAAIFGLSEADADKVPAEGEWQVRRVYAHILSAEINFTITVRYALEKHRASAWTSESASEEDEYRLAGMNETEYQALLEGPFEGMLAYHRDIHPMIIEEFGIITDAELDLPSTFWEETRFPIQHRLHRYEAHYAQHTIQIDKTLEAIGNAPTESMRLIRKLYAALAEAGGLMIGLEKTESALTIATADSIIDRTKLISVLLK
ncbi:MAG TPA: DinB family protein [Anaerolineales bacterium]|nr:DinB family protein [Anaerolineales bacterium]